MPPYWDNKALPTPTLTLPDTFIFNFLIIFIFIEINAFPVRYEIWKGEKKFGKRRARTLVYRVKKRDGPPCRTQDPGGEVGSRSNSSHLTYT